MENPNLTKREWLVMTLAVSGLSKKQIAEKINRSYHTVSMIYRSIYAKLHIYKETELVREWFIRQYDLCRSELYETLNNPAIYGVLFFLMISLAQIFMELPALRTGGTARVSRSMKTQRARRKGENDFFLPLI